jgi:hypothetical protein
MVQTSFQALLVTAVSTAPLPDPGFGATTRAAVSLSAITMPTDPEHSLACAADPLTENRFAMRRHVHPQADWTTATKSWQVRSSFDVVTRLKGCQAGTPPLATTGIHAVFRLRGQTYTFGSLFGHRNPLPVRKRAERKGTSAEEK